MSNVAVKAGLGALPARVGIVGCGKISAAYLRRSYEQFTCVACADIEPDRARTLSKSNGLEAMPVEDLLSCADIDVVLNLTTPQAHVSVGIAALRHGKHLYLEKPLGLDRSEAAELLLIANQANLLVGCAPDTFLGAGLQTGRRLIDEGRIGTPVAAMAHMVNHGHEHWHPDPAFYYLHGGGPLLDMGPYYVTALVSLLGPVRRVAGAARGIGTERIVSSGPRVGEVLKVEVPTHVAGVLDFADGVVATLVTSFDVWRSTVPRLEIHGSEGSLLLPDPNTFDGPVRIYAPGMDDYEDISVGECSTYERGIGLACLAAGSGENRASGQLAYHVLDVLLGVVESASNGGHVVITSSVERPQPMPVQLSGE